MSPFYHGETKRLIVALMNPYYEKRVLEPRFWNIKRALSLPDAAIYFVLHSGVSAPYTLLALHYHRHNTWLWEYFWFTLAIPLFMIFSYQLLTFKLAYTIMWDFNIWIASVSAASDYVFGVHCFGGNTFHGLTLHNNETAYQFRMRAIVLQFH